MIFDSSVWINYLTGKGNSETNLLDGFLATGIVQHVCPPIIQEVLQGIKDSADYQKTRNILFLIDFLQLDSYYVAEEGAQIYRALRKKGVTLQKPNDCLIAFYAIHFKLELVHNDKDFDKIAKHTSLKVYAA
jgi:predicted nucleic acid-binding protein